MINKTYKKITKQLDKILLILQKEEVSYKRDKYSGVKVDIYRAIKELKRNKNWWINK